MRSVPVMGHMAMISPIYGVNPAHMDRGTLLRQTKSLELSRIRVATSDTVGT
jgi:hypothetical protein